MHSMVLNRKGESSSKTREVILSVSGTFIIKGLALVISFLTMPAYIRLFGDQTVLGIWLTVVSVATWILTFDFGVGNGLRNKLVRSLHLHDDTRCSALISSAYAATFCIAIAMLLFGLPPVCLLDWNSILNVDPLIINAGALRFSMGALLIGLSVQLVLKTISSILYALQRPATNNFIALVTSILILMWVLLMPAGDADDNIVNMAIAYSFLSNMPLLMCTISVFCRSLKSARPKLSNASVRVAREVLGSGIVFLWAQLMFMLMIGVNEFVIAALLNPAQVVDYQIYNKIFGLVTSVFSLALTPLWSQVTRAQCEEDYRWIGRVYKFLHLAVVAAFCVEILIALFSQSIADFWIGSCQVDMKVCASAVFVVYGTLYAWQSVESTLACGMGMLRVQNIVYTVALPIRFVLFAILVSWSNDWASVIGVNSCVLLFYCVVQYRATSRHIQERCRLSCPL